MRADFDALHELAKCRNESAGFGSAQPAESKEQSEK